MTDLQHLYQAMEDARVFVCKYYLCDGDIRFGIEHQNHETVQEIRPQLWCALIEKFKVIVRKPLECGCVIEIINPTYVDWRTLPAELEF